MCTSLQNIVMLHDRHALQQDIKDLFRPKNYPKFELKEFYSHQLHQQNQHFRFFVDILEEWNRKIDAQAIPNHFDTVLEKNVFIFNSLRNTIMHPPPVSHLHLMQLYRWFNSTPNRNIRVIGKMQKQLTEQDEDWIVRNTFKSNLPSEIDSYHRRIVCRFKQGREKPCEGAEDSQKEYLQNDLTRKVKTQVWAEPMVDNERQRKRIAQIENELVRFQREQEQLKNVQIRWKVKKVREEERNTKDFYRACFSTGKSYFPKKRKTLKENRESITSLPLGRLNKTSGEKKRKHAKELTRLSAADNPSAEATLRKSEAEIDKFREFQPNEIRLSEITGLRLMENPLESKLKKKKRRGK